MRVSQTAATTHIRSLLRVGVLKLSVVRDLAVAVGLRQRGVTGRIALLPVTLCLLLLLQEIVSLTVGAVIVCAGIVTIDLPGKLRISFGSMRPLGTYLFHHASRSEAHCWFVGRQKMWESVLTNSGPFHALSCAFHRGIDDKRTRTCRRTI